MHGPIDGFLSSSSNSECKPDTRRNAFEKPKLPRYKEADKVSGWWYPEQTWSYKADASVKLAFGESDIKLIGSVVK